MLNLSNKYHSAKVVVSYFGVMMRGFFCVGEQIVQYEFYMKQLLLESFADNANIFSKPFVILRKNGTVIEMSMEEQRSLICLFEKVKNSMEDRHNRISYIRRRLLGESICHTVMEAIPDSLYNRLSAEREVQVIDVLA